jgi:ElaB/YqjD/DUF883 family membrane-anchored ribosome-binding protein
MGAPIRTSTSDVPDFSTYPAAPSDHLLSAPQPAAMNDVASEIGTRLGEGMVAVRGFQERASARLSNLRDTVRGIAEDLRDRSLDASQASLNKVRDESRARFVQAKQYAEARPLAVIAAAGVAGLLLGAGARAWRNNRG